MSQTTQQVPTRAERVMAVVRWLLVFAVAVVAVWAWLPRLRASHDVPQPQVVAQKYVCPMHPQIVADQPGTCPICQMDLVVYDRNAPTDEAMPDQTPPGTQPLKLALDRVQAIGVRTAVAESVAVTPTVLVTGQVRAAEPGRSEVHVRAPSFIEKVLVQETGSQVHKGDPLALIYSPEIIAVQGEVLAAGQWADKTARAAVRQRLALYGLTDAEMDALFRDGKPRRLLTLRAPQDGVVMARAAVPGGYAMPEMMLFELQDLSTLWLDAQVPVKFVAQLQPGMRAQVAGVTAVLERVLPEVDAERRTQRVRFVLHGQAPGLAPGAWLPVTLPLGPPHDAILVPRDAVLDTGREQYVFVAADGWYLPTVVQVGQLYGERVEILEGLAADDVVVATGAFLLDAESRVQASVKALTDATPTGGQP